MIYKKYANFIALDSYLITIEDILEEMSESTDDEVVCGYICEDMAQDWLYHHLYKIYRAVEIFRNQIRLNIKENGKKLKKFEDLFIKNNLET